MTNEELYQQAKNEVARAAGYADWSGYYFRITEFVMIQELEKAACRAIQKAREEGSERTIQLIFLHLKNELEGKK